MRIDARNCNAADLLAWNVWHCELMKQLGWVVYADDTHMVYGVYTYPGKSNEITEILTRKITINTDNKMIFINPIDDSMEDSFLRVEKIETV